MTIYIYIYIINTNREIGLYFIFKGTEMFAMDKKLLTTKTDTLSRKIGSIDGRANRAKVKILTDRISKAECYRKLQLAAELFSKNLKPICEKALENQNTTKLNDKLQNFELAVNNSKLTDEEKNSVLEKTQQYIKNLEDHIGTLKQSKGCNYSDQQTKPDKLIATLQSHLQGFATTCRQQKQRLKKEVTKELKIMEEVCKTTAKYEMWFEKAKKKYDKLHKKADPPKGKEPGDLILAVLNKQASDLQKQARKKWTKYRIYCTSDPQKGYLLDDYAKTFEIEYNIKKRNNLTNYQAAYYNYDGIKCDVC